MKKSSNFYSLLGILFLTFLFACQQHSVEKEIYEHLEETVALEEDFHTYKNEIVSLEEKEQEVYEQIIDLTAEDHEQIHILSQEALEIIDERGELLKQEKESLKISEEKFKEIELLIEKLGDEMQDKAFELYDVMMERYASYDKIYDAYVDALAYEEELYTTFLGEDLERKDVYEKISKINDSYQIIQEAVDEFREHTNTYNDLKREFYKSTDLNIVFEED